MMMNKNGQSISEYAIIIGVIGSLLLMMSLYFQRSIQRVVKEPIDHLGAFGQGEALWGANFAQQIQEIGIEDNVDPDFSPAVPYESEIEIDNERTVRTFSGGRRRIDIDENTTATSDSIARSFNKIEYDQITRENDPPHEY